MNRIADERPDDGRKTILIVEDDPGTRRVLASGLATSLGMFEVLTAVHGQEAVELLESRAVDVVVTDLAMPVMDGFALIGYLTNRGTTVPVVVLSALAPTTVAEGLDGYGGLTVLRKPTGYPEVARAVLDALERHDLGQVAGIPLASVLQLVEAERRTCSLGVTSGRRRGRLHFESGRLINAFSDDFGAEGEAAAYDILTWSRTAIEFDRLPEGVRRTIEMPTQTLLIEVARRQDEQREREAKRTPPAPLPRTPNGAFDAPTPDGDRGAEEPHGASGVDHGVAPDADPDVDPAIDRGFDPGLDPELDTGVDLGLGHGLEEPPAEASTDRPAPERPPLPDAILADAPEPAAAPEPDDVGAPDLALDPPPEPVAARTDGSDPPEASEPAPERTLAASEATEPTAEHAVAPTEATEPSAAVRDLEPADAAASAPTAAPHAAPPPADAPHAAPHAALVAAIERLTQRVQTADAALAAVAEEVDAFHEAQRRYDDHVRRQEERRQAVEAARRDVADLARQILARMDGLFEAFDAEAPDRPAASPATAPSSGG